MSQNNIDVGILDSFFDVDAVEKLTKSQAIEFGKKMSSGAHSVKSSPQLRAFSSNLFDVDKEVDYVDSQRD